MYYRLFSSKKVVQQFSYNCHILTNLIAKSSFSPKILLKVTRKFQPNKIVTTIQKAKLQKKTITNLPSLNMRVPYVPHISKMPNYNRHAHWSQSSRFLSIHDFIQIASHKTILGLHIQLRLDSILHSSLVLVDAK